MEPRARRRGDKTIAGRESFVAFHIIRARVRYVNVATLYGKGIFLNSCRVFEEKVLYSYILSLSSFLKKHKNKVDIIDLFFSKYIYIYIYITMGI